MQQQPGLAPVPLHGALGHSAQLGQLAEREAAEEVEVHQLREAGIHARQRIERGAELLQVLDRPGTIRGCEVRSR
jgi:hypothetical protein